VIGSDTGLNAGHQGTEKHDRSLTAISPRTSDVPRRPALPFHRSTLQQIAMLTVATSTHAGNVRPVNEDLTLWDPALGVVAIADGMGGHNAGEIASRLAIDSLQRFLAESVDDHAARWPFGFDAAVPVAVNRLRTAILLANREVFRTAAERVEYAGMGTTLTAAIVVGSHVTYASVGDSRLYLFREGDLRQLTRDDSVVGALSEAAGVDPSELEHHPMRHLLTSALGRRAELDVVVDEVELADGDTLLLSTDGMHGAIPRAVLVTMLADDPEPERAAALLVRTALERDGRDNISVAVARVQSAL
jgi:serine/threonine protein phosphatase PrpC